MEKKQTEDSHKINTGQKKKIQDEGGHNRRALTSTLRQMGPSRAKAKHTSLCCYRHPQARPRLRARIQNEPSHLALPLQPSLPLPCFRLMLREQRASAFNGASQFFILLAPQPPNPPPPLHYPPSRSILGRAVEILAQTFRRLPGCQPEQKASFKQAG